MVLNLRAIALGKELALFHFSDCRANKRLFEHRIRNDVRLVGMSSIFVEIVIRIAVALFVLWISKNYTEISTVVTQEEIDYLRQENIVDDE